MDTMILDTNLLTDVTVTDQYVVGKSKDNSSLLKQGERVMLFQGVRTALDYINENLDKPRESGSSDGRGGGHAGNSFKNYKEAMDTFINNPESVVKYDPTEMRPVEFEEQGNDLEYDVTGDFIDIGRVLEGVPEQFGSLHNGNPRNRRVRIVVALAQTHYMTPKEINHRSERVIRLVDALENANVRTEVLAIDSNTCSHTEIVVKKFEEALTIEDVAVATHVDFFRRMCFRASEWSDTWTYGYGRADILKQNINQLKSQLNDEITIFVDGDLRQYNINNYFDELEKKIETELSEPVPVINLISMINDEGLHVHN